MFVLVRTDPDAAKPQAGSRSCSSTSAHRVSRSARSARSPVTRRFAEEFFDDVRVPSREPGGSRERRRGVSRRTARLRAVEYHARAQGQRYVDELIDWCRKRTVHPTIRSGPRSTGLPSSGSWRRSRSDGRSATGSHNSRPTGTCRPAWRRSRSCTTPSSLSSCGLSARRSLAPPAS